VATISTSEAINSIWYALHHGFVARGWEYDGDGNLTVHIREEPPDEDADLPVVHIQDASITSQRVEIGSADTEAYAEFYIEVYAQSGPQRKRLMDDMLALLAHDLTAYEFTTSQAFVEPGDEPDATFNSVTQSIGTLFLEEMPSASARSLDARNALDRWRAGVDVMYRFSHAT